jgi:hypothetical protein
MGAFIVLVALDLCSSARGVGAEGDRVRAVGTRRDQVQCRQPLGVTRGTGDDCTNDQAVAGYAGLRGL